MIELTPTGVYSLNGTTSTVIATGLTAGTWYHAAVTVYALAGAKAGTYDIALTQISTNAPVTLQNGTGLSTPSHRPVSRRLRSRNTTWPPLPRAQTFLYNFTVGKPVELTYSTPYDEFTGEMASWVNVKTDYALWGALPVPTVTAYTTIRPPFRRH